MVLTNVFYQILMKSLTEISIYTFIIMGIIPDGHQKKSSKEQKVSVVAQSAVRPKAYTRWW